MSKFTKRIGCTTDCWANLLRSNSSSVVQGLFNCPRCLPAIKYLVPFLIVLLIGGCPFTARVNVIPTKLSTVEKSPARVALVLTEDFTKYDHRFDNYDYPIGPALHDYALNLTENRFHEVSVCTNETEAIGKKMDAILIPQVSKMVRGEGVGFGAKRNMIIIVEWTLKDGKGSRVLVKLPVTAEGEVPAPIAFVEPQRMGELVSVLFDDLSKKTQSAFLKSLDINSLGGK